MFAKIEAGIERTLACALSGGHLTTQLPRIEALSQSGAPTRCARPAPDQGLSRLPPTVAFWSNHPAIRYVALARVARAAYM